MQEKLISDIFQRQRLFFESGRTMDVSFRLEALHKLKQSIIDHEYKINNALKADLGKPLMESYTSEIGFTLLELNHAIKHLKKWARPRKVRGSLATFPSKSYIFSEPFGVALIIGPWNFPLQLTLLPLVGAIAAGNCAVLKASRKIPTSAETIKSIIKTAFEEDYVAVSDDSDREGQGLLDQKYDKVFFTGSPGTGKLVMEKAAKNLASITLELGGKSPCIVDRDINLDVAVKRILWAKYMNAGQVCVAPDYLLVHEEIKEELYDKMIHSLKTFFGPDPQASTDYGRIVNLKELERLSSYLNDGKIVAGGGFNKESLYFEPTIIEVSSLDVPVMQDEIFGPILPVIEFANADEIEGIIALNPNPLAFYLFSKDKTLIKRLLQNVQFGGGCINDTLFHLVNHNLPFGGRGKSGIGNYHGRYSFDTFSHQKSVLYKSFRFDLTQRYPPYGKTHQLLRKLLLR